MTASEQAVRAAERMRELHRELWKDWLNDESGESEQWAKSDKPDAIMARYILSPPPRDAREFVERCFSEGLQHDERRDSESRESKVDRLAAELAPLLRGDAGEALK